MSVRTMTAIWDSPTLPHKYRLMMLALADHCDDEGVCWPSVPRLAQKCGISERHAKRHLKALERDGWIAVWRSKGGRGKKGDYSKLTNRYALNIARLSTPRGDTEATPTDLGVTPTPPLGVTPTPPLGVTPRPPEPSKESSEEPSGMQQAAPASAGGVYATSTGKHEKRSDEALRPSGQPSVTAPQFDDFWRLYPRQQARGRARKAWAKAVQQVDPAVIIGALEAQLPGMRQQPERYLPYASTWLLDERWHDTPASGMSDWAAGVKRSLERAHLIDIALGNVPDDRQ